MQHFLQVYFAVGVGVIVGEMCATGGPRLHGWFHGIMSVVVTLVFWPGFLAYAAWRMHKRGLL